MKNNKSIIAELKKVHADLDRCQLCPGMIRPVIHGPAIASRVMLIGQAPGPHESKFMRPFAWTAGKTLFKWFEGIGINEENFRRLIYIAAIARCFPGKAKGGGDRKPDPTEIANCGNFLSREVRGLAPELIIPVGTLAIDQVLGRKSPLIDVIGKQFRVTYQGIEADVIALPHPSGASPWPRIEPGKTLLAKAMRLLAQHPTIQDIRAQVTA